NANQNDIDREIKQRGMPDQTIETIGIQEPLDHDLKQKGDCRKDSESRKVHAVDIEFANHDSAPIMQGWRLRSVRVALHQPALVASADTAVHQDRESAGGQQSRRRNYA